jgi:hypothetical protein
LGLGDGLGSSITDVVDVDVEFGQRGVALGR